MTRILLLAATLSATAPVLARAQMVGTYNGTQANGAPISITVESNAGKLYLSGFGVGITTTCPDGEKINENVGVGFEPKHLTQPHFLFKLLANPELYIDSPFTFDNSNNTVSGTVTTYVPALDLFTGAPKMSETCKSRQTFTATLGGDAVVKHGPPKLVIY